MGHFDSILEAALRTVKVKGEVVLVGSDHPKGLDTRIIVYKQLTVYGSAEIDMDEMREVLEHVGAGRIRVAPLISATFPLTEMNAAFAASLGAQKILVEP